MLVIVAVGLLASTKPPLAAALPVCGKPAKSGGKPVLGTYSVAQGEGTTLALGRRTSNALEVRINVDGCRLPKGVLVVGFRHIFSASDGADFPFTQYKSQTKATGTTSASLFLTVTSRRSAESGTYRGTVDIDAEEVFGHRLSVPLAITVQYAKWWIVLTLLGGLTLFIGTFVTWARSVVGQPGRPILKWVWTLPSVLALGAGASAAMGVWFREYWTNPTWGEQGLQQWWILFGLMVSAFIATATTLTAGFDRAEAQGKAKAKQGLS